MSHEWDEHSWVEHLYLGLGNPDYGDSGMGEYGYGDGQESGYLAYGLDSVDDLGLPGTRGQPISQSIRVSAFEALFLMVS